MDVRNIRHATHHHRLSELLKSEDWPTPKWYVENKARKIQTYEEHFTFQLRARYLELENDFRTVLGNFPDVADFITAARISDILRSARECLEQETTELLTVSSSLDLVERYMVWLYPPWAGRTDRRDITQDSNRYPSMDGIFFSKKLTELSESDKEAYPGQLRSVLDETIGLINAQVIQDRIGRGLQINRLKALRLWGSGILLIFFTVSPLATNLENIGGWPSQLIFGQSAELSTWMNAFAMMTLGALGGIPQRTSSSSKYASDLDRVS